MGYFRDSIEKIAGYTPGFQPPRIEEVVKLNTNENPYPPSPKVLKAIAEVTPDQLRRYPDPMANEFRIAAAEVFGLSPDNILCCNGGDDLLAMAFQAFCDSDRPVAYPTPTYSLYPVLADIQGCKTIEIPFDGEFNLPSKLAKTSASLTIVCNPNAPSGTFISVGELASLADELTGVLLVDEAYVDFAQENCLSLVKNFDNVILLRSMSKGYSLAGLRFGFAMANPDLIKGLIKVKDSYNVDAISIAAAAAAIKDQPYHKENVEKVKQLRKELIENLRNLGFKTLNSSANFIFAEIKKSAACDVFNKLVERNIYVRYFDLAGLTDKLRITVGTKQQNDKLIAALKEILTQ